MKYLLRLRMFYAYANIRLMSRAPFIAYQHTQASSTWDFGFPKFHEVLAVLAIVILVHHESDICISLAQTGVCRMRLSSWCMESSGKRTFNLRQPIISR